MYSYSSFFLNLISSWFLLLWGHSPIPDEPLVHEFLWRSLYCWLTRKESGNIVTWLPITGSEELIIFFIMFVAMESLPLFSTLLLRECVCFAWFLLSVFSLQISFKNMFINGATQAALLIPMSYDPNILRVSLMRREDRKENLWDGEEMRKEILNLERYWSSLLNSLKLTSAYFSDVGLCIDEILIGKDQFCISFWFSISFWFRSREEHNLAFNL